MAVVGEGFWEFRWPTWQEVALGFVLFVVLAAVSVLVTIFIVVRLPADYFARRHRPPLFEGRHPALRIIARVAKNVLGLALVVAGVIMLFTPGQGVLTILFGVMLLDFPGKRAMERWLVRRPKVGAAINGMRARYGREPLKFEEEKAP
jgi:hypothetical protein